MKRFVFMNHRIRDDKPRGPVIVCQDELGQKLESNHFELRVDGKKIGRIVFDARGLKECKTHDVKAWVELEEGVEIIPDAEIVEAAPLPFTTNTLLPNGGKPKPASAKLPNKPVKFH